MEIKKNTLMYKIAYGWQSEEPFQTNLCQFFWRLVFSLFVIWPPYLTIRAFEFLIIRGVGSIFAVLLFGYRPVNWEKARVQGYRPFEPISWWPAICDDNYHVMPIMVLLILSGLLLALWLIGVIVVGETVSQGLLLRYLGSFTEAPATLYNVIFIPLITGFITIVTVAIFILFISVVWLGILVSGEFIQKSEWGQIIRAYLRAKKDKVCPIIWFRDDINLNIKVQENPKK